MGKGKLVLLLVGIFLIVSMVGCTTSSPTPSPPISAPASTSAPTSTSMTPETTASSTPSATQAATEPIVLKLVTPFDLNSATHYSTRLLIERVNQQFAGQLTIQYIGSVEAIPGINQPQAVRNGTIDVGVIPVGYYANEFPEGSITQISQLTFKEERESGFLDYWRQLHEQRMNVYYLGGVNKNSQWAFVLKNPITTLADLKGLKFRLGPGMNTLFDNLGLVGVNIPLEETYSALQQGVVNGHLTVLGYHVQQKLWEVAPYFIDHLFWGGGAMGTWINMDKWNSLPPSMQDQLKELYAGIEDDTEKYLLQDDINSRQIYIDNGGKPIELSDEDAKTFDDMAVKAVWDMITPKGDPAVLDKLKQLLNLD